MPTPKSQIKLKYKKGQTEVVYDSNLEATQYYLYELNRAALRDVGKYIARLFRTAYYQHFKKHTGDGGKATRYQVISGRHTTAPRLHIGLTTGRVQGFYAYFQEFGTTTGIPRLGLLTKLTRENVPEIVKIESQYLSGLSDEAQRLESMINEGTYEGDADE